MPAGAQRLVQRTNAGCLVAVVVGQQDVEGSAPAKITCGERGPGRNGRRYGERQSRRKTHADQAAAWAAGAANGQYGSFSTRFSTNDSLAIPETTAIATPSSRMSASEKWLRSRA